MAYTRLSNLSSPVLTVLMFPEGRALRIHTPTLLSVFDGYQYIPINDGLVSDVPSYAVQHMDVVLDYSLENVLQERLAEGTFRSQPGPAQPSNTRAKLL